MAMLSCLNKRIKTFVLSCVAASLFACADSTLSSDRTSYENTGVTITEADYKDALYGFWLGQSIANWTGLVTEMDKIGDIGTLKTGPFYTRDDWGGIQTTQLPRGAA
ncbi:hypothetical protein PN836_002715 [Ningiella sp. W23]|uniref:hypothetical protein n=1 Tax=Ningiella sp. W23 TaxID=3023715 RepID=UPI003757F0B0